MLRLHSASKPIDITLVVGELRDSGQYNTEDGVSATTLVELFRRCRWFANCRSTFPVYWKSPVDAVCGHSVPTRSMGFV